jgi:hypothetical protein
MRIGRLPRSTRWLAAAIGLGVAVTVVIIAAPAGASTTVNAQLAFSGIVTQASPIGGSVVGIHPGDAVDFKPATVPTQGLDALGFPLGDILGGVLNSVTGYQVVLHLPTTFPGGKRDVKLGACSGKSDLKVSFPTAGTYNFTWSAYSVTVLPLLGCQFNSITLDGNAAKDAGIALNASSQWVGKVVAATDPPSGGISIQLPAVSASPKVGPVQVPPVGVPGGSLPTVPAGGDTSSPAAPAPTQPGAGTSTQINYQQPGQSVEDSVVPHGYGGDGRALSVNQALIGDLANGAAAAQNAAGAQAPGLAGSQAGATSVPTTTGRPVNLAANRPPPGQMPVLLSILAILALSLVTATYARLYLLRRNVA